MYMCLQCVFLNVVYQKSSAFRRGVYDLMSFGFLTVTTERRWSFMLHKQLILSAASFAKALVGSLVCLLLIQLNKCTVPVMYQ